jgi:hypothetical protein
MTPWRPVADSAVRGRIRKKLGQSRQARLAHTRHTVADRYRERAARRERRGCQRRSNFDPLAAAEAISWALSRAPVPRDRAPRCCSPGPGTPPSGPSSATPAPDPRLSHATSPPPTQLPGVGVHDGSGQTRYVTVILIVVFALDGAASRPGGGWRCGSTRKRVKGNPSVVSSPISTAVDLGWLV